MTIRNLRALRREILLDDNGKGVRLYLRHFCMKAYQQPEIVEVRTLHQMTFANNSRQGKALAMAGYQDGLLH